jgi:hypothetical protein
MLRVVPHLLTNTNEWFSIGKSTFSMEQYKANSARQVMFNEFKISSSFTLENSFFTKESACCGCDQDNDI